MEERRRTLVGDATIPLADVFQMLSMSQKEGTLIVSDHESRKCIYFGSDGVRLIASGKRRAPKLGDRLVRSGRITAAQLQDILAEQKRSGRKFGEIAIAGGHVTAEELNNLLRIQIEDEICDCFVWKYTNFEFYEGPPPEELTGKDQPITQLSLNVNGLLMEALRRRDEWSLIQQQIPDSSITYVWTPAGRDQIEALRGDPAAAQVVGNLDGINTVEAALDGTLLSAFDVYRVVYDLLQKGFLAELPPDEALAVGGRLIAEGHPERAVPLLLRAVRRHPDDAAALQAYGRALAGAKRPAEAAEQLRLASERWRVAGNADAALACLQEAVQADPQAVPPRVALVRILFERNRADEAVAQAGQLLEQMTDPASADARIALCGEVLLARPADLRFRLALARAWVAKGDREKAREELRAALHHITPSTPQRTQWYREMIDILSDFTEAKVAIDRLMMSDADRRRRRRRLAVAVAIPVALLAAAGGGYVYERGVRDRQVEVRRRSADLRAAGNLDGARQLLLDARDNSGFTLLHRKGLDGPLADVEREIRQRRDREQQELGANLERLDLQLKAADTAALDGRIEEALPIAEAALAEARKLSAGEFAKRATVARDLIANQIREAEGLRESVGAREKEGKYVEAARAVARLVQRFPRSRAAQGVLAPLYVDSVPPGAAIAVNGREERVRTPAVVRIPPKLPVHVSLRREGFAEASVELADPFVGVLAPAPELKRTYAWRQATGGVVEASPAALGGLLLAGSSDGHVYIFDAAGQKAAEEFKETGAGGEIVSPLRAAGDMVFFCANDRHAYAVTIAGGLRLAWKYPTGPPLPRAPAIDPAGALVYLAGGDKRLHAVERQKGAAVWVIDLDDTPGAPLALPGGVVVGTAAGTLLAVDAAGKPRWQIRLGGAISAAPVAAGELLLVGAADGILYAVRAADGAAAWKYQTGGPLTAPVAAAGDFAVAAGRDRNVYLLSLRDGRLLDTYQAGAPLQAAPLLHAGAVYVGADDGALHALRLESRAEGGARLRRLWTFHVDGAAPVRTTPVILGRRLVFGANDRHVYALDLE